MVNALVNNPANLRAYTALVNTLHGGGSLALIGAGSSARVGYPVWGKLLTLMAEEILRHHPHVQDELTQLAGAEDQLWRAEEYRRLLGPDNYAALMRQIFGPKDGGVDRLHELLVRLPFRHVLTTNYDPVLEAAHIQVLRLPSRRIEWRDQADVQEFIQQLGDPTDNTRRYVYLHGRYNDPNGIVLAESDYATNYYRRADTLPKLWSILATQRVVSIGFSLKDLDVMSLFRIVKGQLGHGTPRHFAILAHDVHKDAAVERRRLAGKYGIEPIYYPWSEDHRALIELLEQLLHDAVPSVRAGSECPVSLSTSDSTSMLTEIHSAIRPRSLPTAQSPRLLRGRITLDGIAKDITSIEADEILAALRIGSGDSDLMIHDIRGPLINIIYESRNSDKLSAAIQAASLKHCYGYRINSTSTALEHDFDSTFEHHNPYGRDTNYDMAMMLNTELWQPSPHHGGDNDAGISDTRRISILQERGEIAPELALEIRRYLNDREYKHPLTRRWLRVSLAARVRIQRLTKWLQRDLEGHLIWQSGHREPGNLLAAIVDSAPEFDYEYRVFTQAATAYNADQARRVDHLDWLIPVPPLQDFLEALDFRAREVARVMALPDAEHRASRWNWPVSWGPIHFDDLVLRGDSQESNQRELNRLQRAIVRYAAEVGAH